MTNENKKSTTKYQIIEVHPDNEWHIVKTCDSLQDAEKLAKEWQENSEYGYIIEAI